MLGTAEIYKLMKYSQSRVVDNCICISSEIFFLYFVAANPCHSNPCKNGGTCGEDPKSPGQFQCSCSPGFGGATCEIGKIVIKIIKFYIIVRLTAGMIRNSHQNEYA